MGGMEDPTNGGWGAPRKPVFSGQGETWAGRAEGERSQENQRTLLFRAKKILDDLGQIGRHPTTLEIENLRGQPKNRIGKQK